MPRPRYIVFIAALLCLTLGAHRSISSEAAPKAQTLLPKPPIGSSLYIIQPSDILEIVVWKEPTISRPQVLVRPDGRISISLAQDVQAAGLNPTQLKEKLEELLKEYLDLPVVTVIVSSIQSYRVYVTGKVAKNGPIVHDSPLSVLQALAMSGGFVQFANTREIVVIRGSGEDSTRFLIDYEKIIKGDNYSQNMQLKSGDLIYVP